MHFASAAEIRKTVQGKPKNASEIIGVTLGVTFGIFWWYVITVSNIAIHFYWFLPVIRPGIVNVLVSHICSIPISPQLPLFLLFNIHLFIPSLISFHVFTLLFLPGLSNTDVLFYIYGFVFSVAVFPVGLVLWILSHSNKKSNCFYISYYSPRNSTSESVCNIYIQ